MFYLVWIEWPESAEGQAARYVREPQVNHWLTTTSRTWLHYGHALYIVQRSEQAGSLAQAIRDRAGECFLVVLPLGEHIPSLAGFLPAAGWEWVRLNQQTSGHRVPIEGLTFGPGDGQAAVDAAERILKGETS